MSYLENVSFFYHHCTLLKIIKRVSKRVEKPSETVMHGHKIGSTYLLNRNTENRTSKHHVWKILNL